MSNKPSTPNRTSRYAKSKRLRAHVDYNEMSVSYGRVKLAVPTGFKETLENVTREILRENPRDIPKFLAVYFNHLHENQKRGINLNLICERIVEVNKTVDAETQDIVEPEPIVETSVEACQTETIQQETTPIQTEETTAVDTQESEEKPDAPVEELTEELNAVTFSETQQEGTQAESAEAVETGASEEVAPSQDDDQAAQAPHTVKSAPTTDTPAENPELRQDVRKVSSAGAFEPKVEESKSHVSLTSLSQLPDNTIIATSEPVETAAEAIIKLSATELVTENNDLVQEQDTNNTMSSLDTSADTMATDTNTIQNEEISEDVNQDETPEAIVDVSPEVEGETETNTSEENNAEIETETKPETEENVSPDEKPETEENTQVDDKPETEENTETIQESNTAEAPESEENVETKQENNTAETPESDEKPLDESEPIEANEEESPETVDDVATPTNTEASSPVDENATAETSKNSETPVEAEVAEKETPKTESTADITNEKVATETEEASPEEQPEAADDSNDVEKTKVIESDETADTTVSFSKIPETDVIVKEAETSLDSTATPKNSNPDQTADPEVTKSVELLNLENERKANQVRHSMA